MNQLLYLIPFLLIGGVYYWYMFKKGKEAQGNLNMDDFRKKKEDISKEILEEHLPFLKKWMKDKPIDAYTSATLPTDLGDFVKDAVKESLRRSLTYSRGTRQEPLSYLALSGQDLHFFHTDSEGDLIEHIVFDAFRLKDGDIEFGGGKKTKGIDYNTKLYGAKNHPQVYNLTLGYKNGQVTLQALDRIDMMNMVGNIQDAFSGNLFTKGAEGQAKSKVVGEYFFEKLGEKYPNLKVELKHEG